MSLSTQDTQKLEKIIRKQQADDDENDNDNADDDHNDVDGQIKHVADRGKDVHGRDSEREYDDDENADHGKETRKLSRKVAATLKAAEPLYHGPKERESKGHARRIAAGAPDHRCVTVLGHTDGFGATYSAAVQGLVFAKLTGIEYKHTPSKSLAHAGGNDTQNVAQLDRFLGFRPDPLSAGCRKQQSFADVLDGRNSTVFFAQAREIKKVLRRMYFRQSKVDFEPHDFGGTGKHAHDCRNGCVTSCTKRSCESIIRMCSLVAVKCAV